MAWLRVLTSVARNRKFVKAGPGPSWLWICGLAYCQEGLTDGFIPDEALDYLGVKSARGMVKHLVSAGLWDEVEGGWRVHDYLEHNRSASEVADIREARGRGGKLGGRPRKAEKEPSKVLPENLPENLKVSESETLPKTFSVDVDGSASVAASVAAPVLEKKEERLDVAFQAFQSAYPDSRRKGGYRAGQAFFEAVSGGRVTVATIMAALANHKASEQWQTPKHIPGMDTWLMEERWRQTLPPPQAVQQAPRKVDLWQPRTPMRPAVKS